MTSMVATTHIEVPGGRLRVVDEGDGPPVVLLHAGIANLRSWDAMVPLLVAAGYRVVRYDQRGFGETVTEAVPFSNRADAIAVLDALGIGRAALVGNSRGGVIAFDTAAEFPDRFVAVVGVAAGFGGYEATATPEEMAAMEANDELEYAEPPDVPAIADAMVRFWVDGLGQSPDRVPSAIREAIRAQQTDILRPDRVNGEPIPLDPPAEARLSSLTMPILAVAGRLDSSEMTDIARHIAAAAPNARAVIWEDVAHMIGMEQPERLATLVDEFLAPLPRWS
jgi:pimeloyl-ACP methyl ester carboxylesterase